MVVGLLVLPKFAEFLHGASPTVRKEAGAGFVPQVEMEEANPMGVAAVHADVNRSRSGASVVATPVSSFKAHSGLIPKGE